MVHPSYGKKAFPTWHVAGGTWWLARVANDCMDFGLVTGEIGPAWFREHDAETGKAPFTSEEFWGCQHKEETGMVGEASRMCYCIGA